MKARIIKRLLTGALALTLAMAPSMGALAVSGNGTSAGTKAGTVAGAVGAGAAETEAQIMEAFPNAKSTSTVAGIKTSVSGVYMFEKNVVLATLTSAADLAARYALPNGARAFVKAYDMDVKKSNLAKACMDKAAAAYGATVFGYLNFELGMMQNGKYSLLAGGQGVDAVLSIPKNVYVAGGSYGVICVQEGGVVTLLQDTTPENDVITVTLPAGRSALALVKIG